MSTDIVIALGERIRELRLEKGWRQIDLAEQTGVHENYVSELELGRKEICLRTLQSVARAFEMKTGEMLKTVD